MKRLENKKILVVDDEESLREILCYMLEEEGAIITQAAGGNEALEKIKTSAVDIIISDFKMPSGDGLSLLKAVQLEIKPAPIFFMYTGFINDAKENALALGAKKVFLKPFDMEAIIPDIVSLI